MSVLSTQLANVTLYGFLWLFLNMSSFLSFLKANLNGLKQLRSKGCKAWEVWDGRVIIFSLASYACSIAFKITCDPCSFRIKRCLFVEQITCRPCFFLHFHTRSWLTSLNVILFNPLTFENVKAKKDASSYIYCTIGCHPFP